jgi:hypothetical protein
MTSEGEGRKTENLLGQRLVEKRYFVARVGKTHNVEDLVRRTEKVESTR